MPDSSRERLGVDQRPSTLLIGMTLFGSYCLTANMAIALHEMGHIAGCWIGGGKPLGLVLGPQGISGSYAARDARFGFTKDYGYFVHTLGGVAFGTLFGLLFLAAAPWFQRDSVGWIIGYMSAAMCFANNGAYRFVGGLNPFDDAQTLLELGVPRWLLL